MSYNGKKRYFPRNVVVLMFLMFKFKVYQKKVQKNGLEKKKTIIWPKLNSSLPLSYIGYAIYSLNLALKIYSKRPLGLQIVHWNPDQPQHCLDKKNKFYGRDYLGCVCMCARACIYVCAHYKFSWIFHLPFSSSI